jgi:acetyltransferase-like isoleucine patch superfamily enzyme
MENTIEYERGKIEKTVTFGKNSKIKTKRVSVRDNCVLGENVQIFAESLVLDEGVKIEPNVVIRCKNLHLARNVSIASRTNLTSQDIYLGENTTIGDNTTVVAFEKLKIGKDSIIRRNARFKARSIEIGDFFYSNDYPTPLVVGGGGAERPTARLEIGSRCVVHDSFINVCMPVEIGDNVGFSPGSAIITHGFWNPVIEGYSSEFAPVKIGNNVFVGYRALILPGVTIGDYCTIGAGAVVTKSFQPNCVIGGVPAKVIKTQPDYPKKLAFEDKVKIVDNLIREYAELLKDKIDEVALVSEKDVSMIIGRHLSRKFQIVFSPHAKVESWNKNVRTIVLAFERLEVSDKDFSINLSDYTWRGTDDEVSDDLRDFLRHYGIRIFSRHFRSIPIKLKTELEP